MSSHYAKDPFEEYRPAPVSERGDWLATSLGGMWSIDHPHVDDVDIRDIAAGLSRTCRYGGQLIEGADFLAVTEHSCIMTEFAVDSGIARSREDALAVLLHDAAEAYFGDIPTPIKRRMPEFRKMEDRAQAVIEEAFCITPAHLRITRAAIKLIDERVRIDERRQLIAEPARSAGIALIWESRPDLSPLDRDVQGLNPREAREQFLETFIWVMSLEPAHPETDARLSRHHEAAIAHLDEMFGSSPAP